METPFKKSPIEPQQAEAPSFSADSLRNPAVSMDRNKSGEYSHFINEARGLLQKIQEAGFWSPQQVEKYAKDYPSLNNALEVMRKNTLIKNIVEDRPMDMAWSYDEKGNTEIYSALDQMLSIKQLDGFQKESFERKGEYEDAITRTTTDLQHLFEDEMGISVSLKSPFSGCWRIGFSRNLNGENYSFYVNISSDKKEVALLSYIPPTEILYAFRDLKTIPLIKDLLEIHPRLSIQLPAGVEEKIKARRQKEKEYQEKIAQLSATAEINPTIEVFESGVNVPQGKNIVIPAERGPIGTTGVGPCVVVCHKGRSQKGELFLGLAHIEATQNAESVLQEQVDVLVKNGVLPEEIERFLVGGWRSTEELQKRLIELSKQFPMKGVKVNMKEHNTEYPEKKNYIDVAITPAGDILYGENGEVFKVKSGN